MIDKNKVKYQLGANGMYQADFALEMNMDLRTLSNRLNGSVPWRFEEVYRMSKILNCDINDLIKEEEYENN